eukprot:g6883.t1
MKFLYTRLDFPYPLFVTTVNSLAGFLVVTTQAIADAVRKQWKQSPAEGPASRCEGDEEVDQKNQMNTIGTTSGVLHGFSYAGMNVALHRLDSVTFGMLAKNVLLMDLFVFFLLDALAAAELVSQVKGSLFEPVRVVVVEDAKEKREEKTAAEVAGVYPRAGETATQDECEDDDMGASTKRTTTEEQADAEIKRKGQADRRRIPIQDYGSTARWAMTRPASAIANTTSASAEPPPAKLPSLEDQEGRFLFPWQRLRAGRRFLLQLFVITLGATGSVVLATLVTPSRGIKGINDPELQAVFSGSLLRPAASRDPVFAVLVLVVALLLTSAGQAILLYCTSPALRVLPQGTQPTTATATNKLSALECSTRMAFAQFLTLCVLCAALEGVDRPLRLLFLETNRTRCLVLGFCSLLGLAVSLTFAQLAKLAGTSSVLTGCFRYVNFGVLAVFSALILHTRISPDQIACSLLMLLGAGSIAADAASPQGLFLSDVESPLPEGGEGGVGDHPASSGGSDYTILCGTALGFWRHPGFLIPYDDDVDVAVPRSFWERVLKYALDRGLGARKTDHSEGEGARTGSVVEDRQMWVLASIPSGSSLTTTAPAPPKTTVAIVYQSRHLASADEIFEKSGATYVLVIDSHIVKECVRDLLGRDEAAKFAEGDLEWGADDPVLGKWGNKWEISDGRHPTNVMAAGFGGRFFMRHVVNPKELAAAAEAHKREQRASDVKRKLEAWEAGGAGDTSEVVMTEEEAVALLVEQRNAEEGWTGEKKQAYMTEHGGRWFTHVDVWADLSQWDFCGESSWNHQMLRLDADFPETELVRYCGVPVRAFSTSTKRARGWGLGGLAPGPPQVQRAGQTQHTGKGENDRGSPRISWAKGENLLKRHLRTCYGNDLGPPKHGVTLEFDANAFDAFREQVSGVLSPVASWFSSLFR